MEVLKVSAKSAAGAVAGALAGTLREHGEAELQAIGAGAVNQAVKAVAIARGYFAESGSDLLCRPSFFHMETDEQERTGIRLEVRLG